MEQIKLQAVLALINQYEIDEQLHIFSLRYVKSDGKTGFKALCRKSGGVSKASPGEKSNFGYKVKEKGVLMLVDLSNGQNFSLKIRLLTHFNEMRIQH